MPWTKIPWRLLVDHAPIIVEAARRLYASSRPAPLQRRPGEHKPVSLESLERDVEQLAARDAQQAELVAELARQVQELTTAFEAFRARLRWVWVGVALALVVAVLAALLLRR